VLQQRTEEEKRLWEELGTPGFDPENSDARPAILGVVAWRELTRLLGARIAIFVVLVLGAFAVSLLSGKAPVALIGGALCGGALLPLSRIPPSRRWTNTILLALDLASDLTPDTVARCLLELAEGDRFLRYRASSYARPMLHRALENALSQTRYFVANDRECRFLLHMAHSHRYPVSLRIAAIQALAPPGIALDESLRRRVVPLSRPGTTLLIRAAAQDVLRRG
jgi:hypothetical protein